MPVAMTIRSPAAEQDGGVAEDFLAAHALGDPDGAQAHRLEVADRRLRDARRVGLQGEAPGPQAPHSRGRGSTTETLGHARFDLPVVARESGHPSTPDEGWTVLSVVSGGATGTRTPDLLHAMQTLSQLSYSPVPAGSIAEAARPCA